MRYRGSFTVEAALIMPMILGVIVLFIYLGMFMLDRCTIEYICQQASCTAVKEDGDMEAAAGRYAEEEISERLLLNWDTDIRTSSDERSLLTTIEARCPLFNGSFTHSARAEKHFCPKY